MSLDFELTAQSSPTPPALAASSAVGNQLTLTWPGWAAGYSLYAATNLTPPVMWIATTNSAVFSNNQWRVLLPSGTNGQRFYRMQRQ